MGKLGLRFAGTTAAVCMGLYLANELGWLETSTSEAVYADKIRYATQQAFNSKAAIYPLDDFTLYFNETNQSGARISFSNAFTKMMNRSGIEKNQDPKYDASITCLIAALSLQAERDQGYSITSIPAQAVQDFRNGSYEQAETTCQTAVEDAVKNGSITKIGYLAIPN